MAQVTINKGGQVYNLHVDSKGVRAERGVPIPISEVHNIIQEHRTQLLVALFLDECAASSIKQIAAKMGVQEQSVTNARYNWGTVNRPPRKTWLARLEKAYGKNLPK